jgi:hypothetical protein
MISSTYVSQQWALLACHLQLHPDYLVTPECIDACVNTLDVLCPEALHPVLCCLRTIQRQVGELIRKQSS